jgi:hypothetical protein
MVSKELIMKKFWSSHRIINWILGSVVVLSLTLTACGKKNKTNNLTNGRTGITAACTAGSGNIGVIYGAGLGSNFRDQVAGFLSRSMNPEEVGLIDGAPGADTGIDFQGNLKYNEQGQLIRDQSSLSIAVIDSYQVEGQAAIPAINFSQNGTGGTIDTAGRTFSATFQDAGGSITLSGQYDEQFASGTVQYQNATAYSGFSNQSGTLGTFKISRCALLN